MSEIDEFDQHAGIGRTSSPGCSDKADKIGQHLCVRRDVKGDTDHRARKTGAIRRDIHAAPACVEQKVGMIGSLIVPGRYLDLDREGHLSAHIGGAAKRSAGTAPAEEIFFHDRFSVFFAETAWSISQ